VADYDGNWFAGRITIVPVRAPEPGSRSGVLLAVNPIDQPVSIASFPPFQNIFTLNAIQTLEPYGEARLHYRDVARDDHRRRAEPGPAEIGTRSRSGAGWRSWGLGQDGLATSLDPSGRPSITKTLHNKADLYPSGIAHT
jgi:hypothetical protein